jgi:succinate-acetate transporter protein
MLTRVRAMPGGIRLFLVYGMLILAGIAIVLPAVVERAVGAVPVTFDGLVVMCLLAYTIFTLTLVLQRKQAGRGLALGLTSLALPLIPLLLLAGAIIQAGVVTAVAVLLFRGLLRDEVRAYLDEP